MEVELGGSVLTRQASSGQADQLREDKVGCTKRSQVTSLSLQILIFNTGLTAGGEEAWLPEWPLFSTVTLMLLVWPMKVKGCRAPLTWTLLVTMLIGDWRSAPQLGN